MGSFIIVQILDSIFFKNIPYLFIVWIILFMAWRLSYFYMREKKK
jgi:hypothetical protein